jgi:hypothetical protein
MLQAGMPILSGSPNFMKEDVAKDFPERFRPEFAYHA